MAHNLEIVNGVGAFYSYRQPAWHSLGTICEDAKNAQEALEIAKLDWAVEKYPIFATGPDGVQVQIEDRFATGRVHKELGFGTLGVVGNYYEPVQNIDAFSFCDNIAFEGGFGFETAGSLDGGRRTFLSMQMPEAIELAGGRDIVNLYLMIVNSHDGTSPLTAAVTPVRPVCANTVRFALDKAVSTYKVRHTKNAQGKVEEAKAALGMTLKYKNEFNVLANRLIDTEMNKSEFINYVRQVLPVAPEDNEINKRTLEIWNNKFDDIVKLWDAPTQDNIRGTAWAGYNAVVEYADWISVIRGKDEAQRRGQRIIEGTNNSLKDKALALLV